MDTSKNLRFHETASDDFKGLVESAGGTKGMLEVSGCVPAV